MARIFIEGFESGDSSIWDHVDSGINVVSAPSNGMTGSYCLELDAVQHYIQKNLSVPSLTSLYVSMKMKTKSALPVTPIAIGLDNGQNLFLFGWDGDLKNYIYRGATLLGVSANPVYSTSTKYLMEVYFKLGTSDGRVILKLNGNVVHDFTGDTKGTATRITSHRHGHPGAFLNTVGNCFIDDVVLDTTDWIGETYVAKLPISGSGFIAQWTPSVGSNWECVDEAPYSDTDYVNSYIPGPLDLYTQSGLTFSIGTVKAIDCRIRSWQPASPSLAAVLACALRSGLTNFTSAGITIGNPAQFNEYIFETNPITGTAFTESEMNGLQLGMKLN